jgi:N12 class adenine-specific DNA methylase
MPQMFETWHREWGERANQLLELLTDEEYEAARASTPNAHYTSPTVVTGIWEALRHLGYRGGRVLEPGMGAGYFLTLAPQDLASRTRYTGVELDDLTGRVARLLFPQSDIRVEGFEAFQGPDGFYDLSLGNVPFGDYRLHDPRYNRHRFSIHDYFFAKALDKVRPGGVVAFITSRYTMDRRDPAVRRYLAERADLLGAIRLPNTAFQKVANTEVTTDILFLRKRAPEQPATGESWATLEPVGEQDIEVNEYFARHPEMMLGTMDLTGTMYRGQEPTLEPKAGDLGDQLREAIGNLPRDVLAAPAPRPTTDPSQPQSIAAPETVKEGAFVVEKGKLLRRIGGELVPAPSADGTPLKGPAVERIKALVGIRDAAREVLATQLADAPEAAIRAAQQALQKVYDRFVKRHGPINKASGARRTNLEGFRDDPDAPLVAALEHVNEDKGTVTKADIFTKRVIRPPTPVSVAERPEDALLAVLNERGRVDLARMADLTGLTEAHLIEALEGQIFQSPETAEWESAALYLSGNVRHKLAMAQGAALADPKYQPNVEALAQVQPTDLPPSEIDAQPGAPWIPPEDIAQFIADLVNDGHGVGQSVRVFHVPALAEWRVEVHPQITGRPSANQEWGTSRLPLPALIEHVLNLREPQVYDRTLDGKSTINTGETLAAQEKVQKLKDRFRSWLWEDAERGTRLHRTYNDTHNNTVPFQANGSHLTFPGMAQIVNGRPFAFRPHQPDAVWRVLQTGNTLLAHVVGAGKTYVMVAAGMEAKRIGLAHKPLYVVPNHMLEQFTRELVQLYPAARVLMATKEDLAKGRRLAFVAKVAANDWDAVVVTHSSFGKIPMSPDFEEQFIRQQLVQLEDAMQEAEQVRRETRSQKARSIVKPIEKAKKRLEARLKELEARDRKDDLLSFEELGVDMLFVDEAHLFKNLYAPTKMQRVQTGDAQRAMDLFMKSTYLNGRTPGRGLVFATGTPISNSIVEMYTMLRYLMPDRLAAGGMGHFDAWAATFGDVVTQLELRPEGGFRIHSRFARFRNVPELAQLYRSVADVQTAEMLDLPRPTIRGGQAEVVAAEESEELAAYQRHLVKRAEAIRQRKVEPRDDNMLKLTGDGRRAALDMRLVDPSAPDLPTSKVNLAVDRIHGLWEKTAQARLTQLVFIDLSTPKPKASGEFSVYEDMRQKLIARGVPANEVVFIHEATTDKAKAALFAKVREGRVRILMGSTEKMGMGTNVQDRLVALHHLDAPWRPSDIEQREGRILRQGNQNTEVEIIRYVTEGSFDGYIWQLLETKARFIDQVQRAEAGERTVEDVDGRAMTFAEIKAIATGNPLVMEKAQVDADVLRLSRLQRGHMDRQFQLRQDLATLPERRHALEQTQRHATTDAGKLLDRHGDKFEILLGRQTHTKRPDAGEALLKGLLSLPGQKGTNVRLGTFAGLELWGTDAMGGARVWLHGELEYDTRIGYGSTGLGALQAVEYIPQRVQHAIDNAGSRLEELARREKELRRLVGQPFERAEELATRMRRQEEINSALDLDKQRSDVVAPEAGEPGDVGPIPEEPELLRVEHQAIDAPAVAAGEPDPTSLGEVLLEPPLGPPVGLTMPEAGYAADLYELARQIETPARYKHLREALGRFVPEGTAGRIEVADVGNLFTLAHELAHAVDYRLSGDRFPSTIGARFAGHLPSGAGEQVLRGELVRVAQFMRPVEGGANNLSAYRRRHSELMSDYYSLYLLDPAEAESWAPTVTAAFLGMLPTRPQLADAIGAAVRARVGYGPAVEVPEIRPVDVPTRLIPDDIEGDYTEAVKALVKHVPRTFRLMKDRAKQAAERWRGMANEEQREDIGAAVEGISNLRTGKPADAVQEGLNATQRRILREYRLAQEQARQSLNEFMREMRGDDYVNYLEDYLLHFYVRDRRRMRPFAARWARNVPSAKARRLPTLPDAVDAGLTPITQDVAALHELWAQINWRGAINQRFVHELGGVVNAEGRPVIMKPKDAPPDWPVVDHPAIQRVYARKVADGTVELWHGGAAVDPEVYRITKQIFEQPFTGNVVRAWETFNAFAKWSALSLSLFHHWALTESANAALARAWNPVRGLVLTERGLRGGIPLGFGARITQPHREGLRLVENPDVRRDLTMHGLNVDPSPDVMIGRVQRALHEAEARVRRNPILGHVPGLERLVRGVRQFKEWFDFKLWNRYYTGLKAYTYYDLVREQMARMPDGATPDAVRRVKEKVAELVNDMFGGQEWEGKFWLTPKGRQVLHWFLLAPDWTLSNIQVAAKSFSQAKDPVTRKVLSRYWRNMLAGFFAFVATANYVLTRRWPWQNEPGHKLDIDVTPIMRALPWTDPDEERRYFIKPGKQFREVVRYVTDPVGIVGPKMSPGMHIFVEQITGHQAGQWGWEMPWARDELGWYESLPERTLSVMEKFTPFAVRGHNFAFTFPMSRGMSWYKAQKSYEDIIRAQVDPSLYRRLMPSQDAERLKAEIDAAAELNGLDPKDLYQQANSLVRGSYYGEFWKAMDRQDMKDAERLAGILRALGAKREGLEASGERRGVRPETIRQGRTMLPSGRRPPGSPSRPSRPQAPRP